MKNCNMILTENLLKYENNDPEKLISMNFLQAKKFCPLIKVE